MFMRSAHDKEAMRLVLVMGTGVMLLFGDRAGKVAFSAGRKDSNPDGL